MIRSWYNSRKDERRHKVGYEYAKSQYEENPTKETLMRLMAEQEDEFEYRSFNLGMQKAIVEIILESEN